MGSPRALPKHTPQFTARRPTRNVQLGSTFALKPARAHIPETGAPAEPETSLVPDERQMRANYDPTFYQEASAPSTVFWSIYAAAVLVACGLFFFYS